MGKILRLWAIISFATLATTVHAEGEFGRYTGVFRNERLGQEQLAKLDFVFSRQNASEFTLIGLLTLSFGDYSSPEYVTYHFDKVRYDLLTSTLVFDQPDQDTTFVVNRFAQGVLEGELRSAVAGNVGRLVLNKGANSRRSRPMVQPLGGEYRGRCGEYGTILQVQTQRSSDDTSRVGDPFGTYGITAQLAEFDPNACSSGGSACVKSVYSSGSYNFFDAKLNLYGLTNDLDCRVKPDALVCNGCTLTRHSGEAASGSAFTTPTSSARWAPVPAPGQQGPAAGNGTEGLAGEYFGYVHHEALNVYQAAGFNLVATTDSQRHALIMSGVAKLSFGGHTSEESISYRFNEKTYDLLAPQFIFERLDGDVDAIVQVTRIGGGTIQGIWYSMLFGRVGTFVFQKGRAPALPAGSRVMEQVAGAFKNAAWSINLRVARERTPVNTENPFFPLNFKGHAVLRGISPHIPIKGGSFDFYTGKISFALEDESVFAGMRPSRGRLLLKRPTPDVIMPLAEHAPLVFQLTTP